MIKLFKDLQFFRCTKSKYLVKKGSMSNYSFDIIDEKGTGVVEYIFEKEKYPVDEENFNSTVRKYLGDESNDFIEKLIELEVLKRVEKKVDKRTVFVITGNENKELLIGKLEEMNFESIGSYDIEKLSESNQELENGINKCDIVLVLSNTFRPDVFYALNSYIVANDKKTVIAYMDGDEGVILPLVSPKKFGCYNDFELLREATFHNLLEYQVMKEEIVKNKVSREATIYSKMLMDWAIVIMNSICKETLINHFAYSLDFERMHFSKIKLFRFPKCPSCQGDVNLTHPFI